MTYVIGRECVDVTDMSCVQECPADCIHQGDRALYINPQECVDCGACKLICRVDAIYYEDELPDVATRSREMDVGSWRELMGGLSPAEVADAMA